MKTKLLYFPLLAAVLGGCTQFPSGGPGSTTLLHPSAGEHIQTITPEKAAAEAKNLRNQQRQAVAQAGATLREYAERHPYSGTLLAGGVGGGMHGQHPALGIHAGTQPVPIGR